MFDGPELTGGSHLEGGADAVLDEGIGERGGEGVAGVATDAVGGHHYLRGKADSVSTVGRITEAYMGPLRWNPPTTACTWSIPVSR